MTVTPMGWSLKNKRKKKRQDVRMAGKKKKANFHSIHQLNRY